MLRATLGFVAGIIVWMPAFFVLAGAVGNIVWSDYGVRAEAWFEQSMYTFSSPMSWAHVACWALAAALAGWLATAIGRRPQVAWALAAVIALYLAAVHLVFYWSNYPWWYNLGVALPAAPAVLLGAKLARGFVLPRVATSAR